MATNNTMWNDILNRGNKTAGLGDTGFVGFDNDGNWLNQNQGTALVAPDAGGSMVDLSTMSNSQINDFALSNPVAMQKLGESGYTVSTDNLAGVQAPGTTVDPTAITGLQKAQIGLAGLGAGLNYLNYGLNKDKTKATIDSLRSQTDLAQKRYSDKSAAKASHNKVFGQPIGKV